MKIAFIHLNLSTESGDPRMFYTLVQEVKALGHHVVVYTAQFNPNAFPKLHAGLEIRALASSSVRTDADAPRGAVKKVMERLQYDREAARAVEKIGGMLDKDFDALVFQNDPSYRIGVAYKKVNPAAKCIWVMNNAPFYHSAKPDFVINALSWCVARFAKIRLRPFMTGIDLVVVHDNERGAMIRPFGVPVVILRIPVDFKHFFAPVKRRTPGDKKIMLLGVGTLSPARRFEDIISAVAHLCAAGYDARATLVCKDFWNAAGYREVVIGLAKKLNIESRVSFMFDGATEEELRAALAAADVFVFASVINIWNMSSFEAMAAGLPLVVSSATSLPEVLKDGTTALFFKPGDAEDIAEKVVALVRDPERCYAIAAAGQKFVGEHLSWDAYAKEFISHLSS